MTPRSEPWDRGYTIDSRAAACRFVESVWSDDHRPPARIHSRSLDDGGAPQWSVPFARYLQAEPFETTVVMQGYAEGNHFIRTGPDREYWRYPLRRALTILDRRDHDRWTAGVPRRPFHPTPVTVLWSMSFANFDPDHVFVMYADGSRVPKDMTELFVIGAARKLRSVYQDEVVTPQGRKSESQIQAEGAA